MRIIYKFFQKQKEIIFDGLFLFFLTVVFFSRWLFNERYLLFAIDIVQDFSQHHFASYSFKLGEIPIWDPYFTWAIVGYLNTGFFYPFNLLMDIFNSFWLSSLNFSYFLMQMNSFFHYFLASFFMYLLVRHFKISRIPSLVAAVTFAYSGYLVKEYLHIYYLQGAAWFPLIFLFFYRSLFEKKVKMSIWAGIFLAISLLAGQTQPAIYCLFCLGLLVVFFLYESYQEKRTFSLWPIFSLMIVLLVSFGLFAIQFFPTWEYKKYSARQQIDYQDSIQYSADPLYLMVHPFIPTFFGSMGSKTWEASDMQNLPMNFRTKWLDTLFGGLPNEMNFYLGLLPFFLLPFSFFSKNKFLRNFLLILLFFSLLFMLSRHLPLIGRLFWLVVGGAARIPVRAAFLWSFCLSFLSALGLQSIIDFKEEKKEFFQKITKGYLFVFGALFFSFFPALLTLMLLGAGTGKMPYFYFPMLNAFSLFLIVYLFYSIILFFLIKIKRDSFLLFLLFFLLIVELFSYHFENSYVLAGDSPERTLGKTHLPEVGYIKKDTSFFRVHGLGLSAYVNKFFTLGYGTTGLSGMAYRPTMELYSIIPDDASPIYDLLNVKYFYNEKGRLTDLKSSVSSNTFLSDHRPYDAFDGDEETEWVSDPQKSIPGEDWLTISFRKQETVSRMEVLGRNNDRDKEIKEMEIVSSDGTIQSIILPTKEGWKQVELKPISTENLKFVIRNFDESSGQNSAYGLKEVIFFNQSGEKIEVGSSKFQKITGTLYLNKTSFPRAFVTYGYRTFGDRSEMFSAISKDQTGEEMRKNVFLYETPSNFTNPQELPSEESEAIITDFQLRKVTVETEMKDKGFLVLGEIWYPGWKVTVDGKSTHLYSAYQVFRAVQLEKGKHQVIFTYDPLSFKIGFLITFMTIGLLIAYFLLPKLTRVRKIN